MASEMEFEGQMEPHSYFLPKVPRKELMEDLPWDVFPSLSVIIKIHPR